MRSSKKQQLPGGTTRSERAPGFHLMPAEGHRRIAKRFDLGATAHGIDNWKLALKTEDGAFAFCQSAFDHMQEHMLRMANAQDPSDDHLAAIGWGVYAIAHAESIWGAGWRQRLHQQGKKVR